MPVTVSLKWEEKFDQVMHAAKEAIGTGLLKAAFDIQSEARELVPIKTGNLLGSIQVEPESQLVVWVRAEAPYSGYVEWGTSKMAAQPYMMPALALVWPQFQRYLGILK